MRAHHGAAASASASRPARHAPAGLRSPARVAASRDRVAASRDRNDTDVPSVLP